MNEQLRALKKYLLEFYSATEWPCLLAQIEDWSRTRPLEGLRVLDNTPLFRNTLAKHLALLAAGAQLTVSAEPVIAGDAQALARAQALGVRVCLLAQLEAEQAAGQPLDLILDCAGQYASLHPLYGFVELTRSGVSRFEGCSCPVMVADAGRIKLMETALGTGDGFVRAMAQLGYDSLAGKSLVLVGCGKVGRGILTEVLARGMSVTVVDIAQKELPEGVDSIALDDRVALQSAAEAAFCVVTVTGVADALAGRLDMAALAASPALLVNMGVEDEYGAGMPDARVLAGKMALNFILDEPTLMRYMETTMALHNECALELLAGRVPQGCVEPPSELEQRLLELTRVGGCLTEAQWTMVMGT